MKSLGTIILRCGVVVFAAASPWSPLLAQSPATPADNTHPSDLLPTPAPMIATPTPSPVPAPTAAPSATPVATSTAAPMASPAAASEATASPSPATQAAGPTTAAHSPAPAKVSTPSSPSTPSTAATNPAPTGNYAIEIDLGHQRAYLLKDGKKLMESPVSSGRPGHLTPVGNFELIEKDPNHFSNLYGSIINKDTGRLVKSGADSAMPIPKGDEFKPAPMKWFMRFDGASGMHAGILPGYAASHGCVRMPLSRAEAFFSLVSVGTPVHVFGDPPAHEVEAESAPAHTRTVVLAKAAPSPAPKAHHWWF